MFWAILAVLVAIWLLGIVLSRRMGGLIHALPAVAVVLLAIRLTSWAVQTSVETVPQDGAAEQADADQEREPVVAGSGN